MKIERAFAPLRSTSPGVITVSDQGCGWFVAYPEVTPNLDQSCEVGFSEALEKSGGFVRGLRRVHELSWVLGVGGEEQ